MTYPASLDSFTPRSDDPGGDEVVANDVNELQTAITAVETELGTDPAGTVTDVKTRLSTVISGGGYLQFQAQTGLTINSGAVTVSRNYHTLDTEGSAATDDLDTINGGAACWFLILRAVSGARQVVIKHNTGNIYTTSGTDITLDEEFELALGIYDGNLSKWILGSMGTAAIPSASVSASVSPSASLSPSSSVSPSVSPSSA